MHHGSDGDIALRIFKAPPLRPRNGQRLNKQRLTIGLNRLRDFYRRRRRDRRTNRPAISVQLVHRCRQGDERWRGRPILHHRSDFNESGILGNDRGRDKRAPMADMDGRGFYQPHIPINTAPRIPARRRRRVLHADAEHVGTADIEMRREIDTERGIAVRPPADQVPVKPHGRVSHRAIQIQVNALLRIFARGIERLAIPADASPRQLPRLARQLLRERPLDAPVMRQVQTPPTGIVERGPHVGDLNGGRIRKRRRTREIGRERRRRCKQPVAKSLVAETVTGISRVPPREAPIGIESYPFPRRVGGGSERRSDRERAQRE